MPHAIRLHRPGAPEAMTWEEVAETAPGAGELRIRHEAIGVNFVDTYHRSGLYPLALPTGLGVEAAGVVEAVGVGVSGFREGDRVAYATAGPGAYAQVRNVPATKVVHVPDALSSEQAASALLKGMTAEFLVQRVHRVQAGDTILVHAAAGATGQLVVQWAAATGATVIGSVGSAAKIEIAKRAGCAHVVLSSQDWVTNVRDLTGGVGVRAVYDSIGKDTLHKGLGVLAKRGVLVSFGQASGVAPALELSQLAAGSFFCTRPRLHDYVARREELVEAAAAVFARLADGSLRCDVHARYPLREVARAHADLEGRKTSGSLILHP